MQTIPGNLTYKEYLKSPGWLIRRERFIKMAKVCRVCGEKSNLQVHHKIYRNFTQENDKDLVLLCTGHHRAFHKAYGVKYDLTHETNLFINLFKEPKKKAPKPLKETTYFPDIHYQNIKDRKRCFCESCGINSHRQELRMTRGDHLLDFYLKSSPSNLSSNTLDFFVTNR